MSGRSEERATSPAAGARPWRAPVTARIASLVPFFVAIALQLAAPRFTEGLLMPPPDIPGIPTGAILGALVLGWAAFGALVVWTTGSRLAAALALGLLTLPSMFGLILGPAMLLILQNLEDLRG